MVARSWHSKDSTRTSSAEGQILRVCAEISGSRLAREWLDNWMAKNHKVHWSCVQTGFRADKTSVPLRWNPLTIIFSLAAKQSSSWIPVDTFLKTAPLPPRLFNPLQVRQYRSIGSTGGGVMKLKPDTVILRNIWIPALKMLKKWLVWTNWWTMFLLMKLTGPWRPIFSNGTSQAWYICILSNKEMNREQPQKINCHQHLGLWSKQPLPFPVGHLTFMLCLWWLCATLPSIPGAVSLDGGLCFTQGFEASERRNLMDDGESYPVPQRSKGLGIGRCWIYGELWGI